MKRLLFYCQHVLGMGHFMRSAALVQGLAQEFQICFLNGGEIIPGFSFPPGVEVVNLPAIKSDEAFAQIESADGEDLAVVKQRRVAQILATFERWQPDVVVIELYPFGRKKFSFELLPLLARIRLTSPKTQVVCSLRDILVSRPDPGSYETQVCDILNRYFDRLLIHADPHFQRLEESFGSVAKIKIPIDYTGYVAQSEGEQSTEDSVDGGEEIALQEELPLILASIGGGRVGYELLATTVEASALLHASWPHQLLVFAGPYMADEQFARLQSMAAQQPHIIVSRYTTRFLAYMGRATLSISMAGYNTCVNVLTTGVRALLLPFTGGDNNEQMMRANKLAEGGVVTVLQPDDLQPQRLQEIIVQALGAQPATGILSTDGVAQTRAILVALANESEGVHPTKEGAASHQRHYGKNFALLESELRPYLEECQEDGRQFQFFLRDDDIDEEEESLRHLLDIGLSRGVPINLAVIPARLTPLGTRLLKNYKKMHPNLLELHQHGWQHLNHEETGRKCEFGVSRSFAQQLEDIGRGQTLLEETFGERFFPAFTPPWNRCTDETLAVLDALDFKVFSKDAGDGVLSDHRFQEISITLDFMAKGGVQMRAPEELVGKLVEQMQRQQRIGIMLHHKVMDGAAFAFLDELLAELGRYPFIRFHTFESLYQWSEAALAPDRMDIEGRPMQRELLR